MVLDTMGEREMTHATPPPCVYHLQEGDVAFTGDAARALKCGATPPPPPTPSPAILDEECEGDGNPQNTRCYDAHGRPVPLPSMPSTIEAVNAPVICVIGEYCPVKATISVAQPAGHFVCKTRQQLADEEERLRKQYPEIALPPGIPHEDWSMEILDGQDRILGTVRCDHGKLTLLRPKGGK